ncbi:MAG: ACT domain-containing protein [Oscillospiraceae bacterium]|jgi:ACT domain protein|nr:MAG: ACT domain-containing protein [Oscillospiraceae bacterium]
MFIDQISVFMENKKGRLSSLTRILADNGIDLVALSIADTADYGIMRAIVNDTPGAEKALRAAGFMVSTTRVLGVVVPDTPGGLSDVLEIFSRGDVSVEYLYSFVRHQGKNALIMFKVTPVEKAVELLEKAGIELVTQEQVKKL